MDDLYFTQLKLPFIKRNMLKINFETFFIIVLTFIHRYFDENMSPTQNLNEFLNELGEYNNYMLAFLYIINIISLIHIIYNHIIYNLIFNHENLYAKSFLLC